VSGLVALAVGEVTRKRGYGVVAKAVTGLGFAILYAAAFSAHRYYELIGSGPTFVLAVLITMAAMLYAVALDEILPAFLSLLGGFLTPVIISTGENLPMPLFSYVTILSVGAMLCAYYRKWRAVDILAFVGTFVLYTGWFEKFYRPAMKAADAAPEQMAIALGWLVAFFAIYLVLPILHGLVRRVKAQKEDVLLVLANAAVVFYYLWAILFERYRPWLAFCALGLCADHLIMMGVVLRRCKDDLNIRLALLGRNISDNRAAVSQRPDAGWSRGRPWVRYLPADAPAADAHGGFSACGQPRVRDVVFCGSSTSCVSSNIHQVRIRRGFAPDDNADSIRVGDAFVVCGGDDGVVVALRLQPGRTRGSQPVLH
jgi:hypothetical protein